MINFPQLGQQFHSQLVQGLEIARNIQKLDSHINAPGDEAYRLYQHYTNFPGETSFCEKMLGDVGARCLSIAQVITSLVAIPLLLLAMPFLLLTISFIEGRDVARVYVTAIGGLIGSSLCQIPESVQGSITPSTLERRDTGPSISEESLANMQNATSQIFQQGMAQMQQNMFNG